MNRIIPACLLVLGITVGTNANELPESPKPKPAAVARTSSFAQYTRSWSPEDRPAKVLTGLNAAVAFADIGYTASLQHNRSFQEYDPIAKPFVHHPAASMALGAGEVVGLSWLANRMKHSERWHNVWWVPQTAAIAAHGYALGSTVHNWKGK